MAGPLSNAVLSVSCLFESSRLVHLVKLGFRIDIVLVADTFIELFFTASLNSGVLLNFRHGTFVKHADETWNDS